MALPPLVSCLKPMWAAIADLRHTERALDRQAERQLAFALQAAAQLLSRPLGPRPWPRRKTVHVISTPCSTVAHFGTANTQGQLRFSLRGVQCTAVRMPLSFLPRASGDGEMGGASCRE